MRPTVVLITDFGTKDPYVGMMKGVIKTICPEADIIDLTHGIPKYNVVLGAHVLKISRKYFPKGTVFVGVVDPGVGSERRAIIVKSRNHIYVGPDNGLLIPAAEEDPPIKAYEIKFEVAALPNPSHTFHGRDVFAPTGAYLACGIAADALGTSVDVSSLVRVPSLPKPPEILEGSVVSAELIHVDDFGNLITSINVEGLKKVLNIQLGDHVEVSADGSVWRRAKLVKTFSAVCKGCLAVYEGSYGLLEVAVNMGNAKAELAPQGKIFFRSAK